MTPYPQVDKGALLILNSGSSSVKFTIFSAQFSTNTIIPLFSGQLTGIGTNAHLSAKNASKESLADESWAEHDTGGVPPLLPLLMTWIEEHLPADLPLLAAGHRVVHGGEDLYHPVRVTRSVLRELESLTPLAPLHQPQNVAAIKVLAESRAGLPQVACFDTAFHHTQPKSATTYAIPREYTKKGIHRYGFHGLSYEYIAGYMREKLPDLAKGRVVVAHLGNGSSLCALDNGVSVDTTMGFSALDGVPMGTRCGSLDPGILIHLMREFKFDADALEDLLYFKSGLLGVSGVSNDMRALEKSTDPHAREAVDLFCLKVAKKACSMACSMGGMDALVFTAGIGEHSASIRARICEHLNWLGVTLGPNGEGGTLVSTPASIPVHVIPTNEEYMIAKHTMAVLTMRNAP